MSFCLLEFLKSIQEKLSEETAMNLLQEFEKDGFQKGIQQGLEKGKLEGKLETLHQLACPLFPILCIDFCKRRIINEQYILCVSQFGISCKVKRPCEDVTSIKNHDFIMRNPRYWIKQ